MDGGPGPAAASTEVAAMTAAVRRHAAQLGSIRSHALSVALLPWESPAGENFRSYLGERCGELSRTIDLLESAAGELDAYARLVLEAEMVQRQIGP
jgi:hypothetical protein